MTIRCCVIIPMLCILRPSLQEPPGGNSRYVQDAFNRSRVAANLGEVAELSCLPALNKPVSITDGRNYPIIYTDISAVRSPLRLPPLVSDAFMAINDRDRTVPGCTHIIVPFGVTYEKIGTIQRRLAWPLHKDDTLTQSGSSTELNIYALFGSYSGATCIIPFHFCGRCC